MKIYHELVALSFLHFHLPGATAFFVQAPKTEPCVVLHSTPAAYNRKVSLNRNISPYSGNLVTVLDKVEEKEDLTADLHFAKSLDALSPIVIQGGALRTWPFPTAALERVLVSLETEGRPMNANIKVCQGPNNIPQEINVYVGKGKLRPFKTVIETPGGRSSIFIRNKSDMVFPIDGSIGAHVDPNTKDDVDDGSAIPATASLVTLPASIYNMVTPEKKVQGASVHSFEIDHSISQVKVLLKTDGRPLNAKVELIQGPNANKYTIDVYSEDGLERPFFTVLETPGLDNTVRIINPSTHEFPLYVTLDSWEYPI